MTMNFQTVRDALIDLLGSEESGRFRTIGYQKRAQSAEEVKDLNKTVQVFYSQGDFPKSGGNLSGPTKHDMTFSLDFTVSKSAKGPLSVLDNPASTAPELAVALSAFKDASDLADKSIDELFNNVYQVIMDARNIDLGMDRVLGSRWITGFRKDQPVDRGELVVITASAQMTCTIDEQVSGEEPVVATGGVQVELSIADEPPIAGVHEEQDFIVDRPTGNIAIDRKTGRLIARR